MSLRLIVVGCLWTALVLLVACGESEPDVEPVVVIAASPTPSPTATATPVPTPTPLPTPQPTVAVPTAVPVEASSTPAPTPDARTRGGTLNIASHGNIPHQDVQRDVSIALSTWGPGIAYSRLLRLETGAEVELPSLAVTCDLCEKWEMESPTSFRFELRSNARWQNRAPVSGRAVDADDVVYSYLRQSNPESPNAPLLRNLAEVDAVDASTVRVSFKTPDADALLALADGHSKIVAREAVDRSGDLVNGPTVGSGHWILERSVTDEVHTFSRNPDHYQESGPLVEGLNIFILADEVTRNAAFQTGYVDVVSMRPTEWLEYEARVRNAPSLLIPHPGVGMEVAFNTVESPFDDVRVRQAALMAMDPLKAMRDQWSGFARVGPAFPVFSPDWLLSEAEVLKRFNRPPEASALLESAGVTLPIPVTISVGEFGSHYLDHAEAISAELAAVGFEPRLDVRSRRYFGEKVWLGGDYEMMAGPLAPITVPNGYLLTVLHSDGTWNTTGHRDDVLDGLLEAQAVEWDGGRRAELIRLVQDRVLDQAYRAMAATQLDIWTWTRRVQDFHPNFASGEYHHWASVWLRN